MKSILDRISSKDDLKGLSSKELVSLASEIRSEIVSVVASNGGHLASNLGVVELTIALEKVFSSPSDRIVWDVGHQSYTHKLLTGRRERFKTLRKTDGLSGFTSREEDEKNDCFGAGHAGTAISAAMGFAAANEARGKDGSVVAVVGDGAIACGISLEAMNSLRSTCRKLIIVLNDNKMSIEPSIGALPNYLNRIITERNYNRFKSLAKRAVNSVPGGARIIKNIQTIENAAKSFFVPGIFFEEMGIRYVGPVNGHNLRDLVQTFERVKEFNHPVIIHVITDKGHGCKYAEDDPEKFHGTGSFNPETGVSEGSGGEETFSQKFGETLSMMSAQDEKVCAVSAAMAQSCGITKEYQKKYYSRFFDTGMAEEHAVVFSSGLAAAGMRPVVAIYATFLQRSLDCIFHDMCLQNLPVIICADRAGIVDDGPTHHGIYDLGFLRSIPNLAILSPSCGEDLANMMIAAKAKKLPCIIRYPKGSSATSSLMLAKRNEIKWGKASVEREGSDGVIWALGREVATALEVSEILKKEYKLSFGVVDTRFVRPLDKTLLLKQAKTMTVATIEDHVIEGGLGSAVDEELVGAQHKGVLHFGWSAGRIVPHGKSSEIRERFGLTPAAIAEKIASFLGKN